VSEMSQNEVVKLLAAIIASGNGQAHDRLYIAHHRKLRTYLHLSWGRSLSPQDIEDLVQEVFTSIWEAPKKYDPKRASFSTWLITLAKNRASDLYDKKKVRSEHLVHRELDDEDYDEDLNPHQDMTDTVLREIEAAEIAEWIDRCLQCLNKDQYEAFSVRYLQTIPIRVKDYIASNGLVESTFRRNAQKARILLQECLKPLRDSEEHHGPV